MTPPAARPPKVSIQSREEFKKFFEEYFPAVHGFLARRARDGELARDLAQETFVRIYEHRDEIRDLDHAKAFLYTVARNLFHDHLKHATAHERFLASNATGKAWEDHAFLEEVTRQETFRVLHAAIDKLPARCRAVMLARLQGKSSDEIAREMNITLHTVKTLKRNSIIALRALLSRDRLLLLLLLVAE